VLESNAGKTGFTYAWLADMIGALCGVEATNEVYALLDRLAQESPPGAGGLTFALEPVAMGECKAGPAFRGAVFGLNCTGKDRTTASHLARALMENMAAAYSANLEQLERVSGEPIDSVVMCGGSTKSRVQTQIIADSSGRTVRVPKEPETTMLGAAIRASVACGIHGSLDEAVSEMTSLGDELRPDCNARDLYACQHDRWQQLRSMAVDLSMNTEV